MTTPSTGRHRSPGRHRNSSPGRNRAPASPVTFNSVFSRAFRRPLISAAAFVSVAGITAAGYASAAKPQVFAASFTANPVAVAQAAELSDNQIDTNVGLAAARRAGVQRASALTKVQQVAADARASALTRARKAAADRAAREREREGIIARAQSNPQAVGRLLVGDRGWGDEQFGCLDNLWSKESGWRWNADNPGSDAYGIPQALPGSKMASAGSDWATNPVTQIKWGLSYIENRYGTPCGAWAQSRAANWY